MYFNEIFIFFKYISSVVKKYQVFSASLLVFFILILFKVHFSSIGVWTSILSDSKSPVLIGRLREIRSDEWMALTPFYISQISSNTSLPIKNDKLKYSAQDMVIGLFAPVKNLVVILKPQVWGYLTGNADFGLSWFWNIKLLLLFLSTFLWFNLFFKDNKGLSLIFSFMITWSPFIQWWFSTTFVDVITYGLFISFLLIFWAKNNTDFIKDAIYGTLVGYLGACSVATLTPQFLIPIFWILLPLFIGSAIYKFKANGRLFYFFIFIALTFFILSIYYYSLVKEDIKIVLNTVYPGNRQAVSGNFTLSNLFWGSYSWILPNRNVNFLNNCEVSDILSFLPLTIIWSLSIVRREKDKLKKKIIITGVILNAFFIYHILYGIPEILSKYMGFNLVPDFRIKWILNIFSFGFLPFLYLCMELNRALKIRVFLLASLSAVYFVFKSGITDFVDNVSTTEVVSSVFLLPIIYWTLIFRRFSIFCVIIFLFTVHSGMTVNPTSINVGSLIESDFSKKVRDINSRDNFPKWMAVDSILISQFLNANGVKVMGGFNWIPDLEFWKVLDSKGEWMFLYNRYGYSSFLTDIKEQYVKYADDHIGVKISKKILSDLNVKYVVAPTSESCHKLEISDENIIYKGNNNWVICKM